ncbi:hypothetical protein AHAS_Ahas17G0286400 [Arachis hypogaea]
MLIELVVVVAIYSVMQLIMVPEKHLHLFFKKARAGDNPNAEERLEEFDNVDNALKEFTRLFEENNGNQFEPWERDEKFCKKPLKFYPIDMVCANGDGLRLARPSHRNGCTASLEKMKVILVCHHLNTTGKRVENLVIIGSGLAGTLKPIPIFVTTTRVRIASWPRLVESMFPKWRLLLLRSNMFEFTAKQRIFQS